MLISRTAVLGVPSSSLSSRIFFRAHISFVIVLRALYTRPYVPDRPRNGSGKATGRSSRESDLRRSFPASGTWPSSSADRSSSGDKKAAHKTAEKRNFSHEAPPERIATNARQPRSCSLPRRAFNHKSHLHSQSTGVNAQPKHSFQEYGSKQAVRHITRQDFTTTNRTWHATHPVLIRLRKDASFGCHWQFSARHDSLSTGSLSCQHCIDGRAVVL